MCIAGVGDIKMKHLQFESDRNNAFEINDI